MSFVLKIKQVILIQSQNLINWIDITYLVFPVNELVFRKCCEITYRFYGIFLKFSVCLQIWILANREMDICKLNKKCKIYEKKNICFQIFDRVKSITLSFPKHVYLIHFQPCTPINAHRETLFYINRNIFMYGNPPLVTQ